MLQGLPKKRGVPPHLLPFFVRQAAVLEKKRSMAVHHLALWHRCDRRPCPASETCQSLGYMLKLPSYEKL